MQIMIFGRNETFLYPFSSINSQESMSTTDDMTSAIDDMEELGWFWSHDIMNLDFSYRDP